jgi:hypothetical protein
MVLVVKKPEAVAAESKTAIASLMKQMSELKVEQLPIESFKPNPKNARRHPKQQIKLLSETMLSLGNTHPIVVDEENVIISGHGRFEAGKLLKLPVLLAIRVAGLTPEQKIALSLAENRLGELSLWDKEGLAEQLAELTASTAELNFDYSITGFDTNTIDQLVGPHEPPHKGDPADIFVKEFFAESAVTSPGDVWAIGSHRLYCGSALDPSSYRVLLEGGTADVVFTHPPCGAPNAGQASRREKVREFATAQGETLRDFFQMAMAQIAANARAGAVVYIATDWRHLESLSAATRPYFGDPKDMVVWTKTKGGASGPYEAAHEHIAVYVAGRTNGFKLGDRRRFRTNLWNYTETSDRDQDSTLGLHPTLKPAALVVDALRDCSRRGDIVLDVFAGAGTTVLAAERTGRLARLIEIDPLYCDAIVRRWQAFTGQAARLAETNETFDEVQMRRANSVVVPEGDQQ